MPVYLFLRTVYLQNRGGAAFFLKMASFETQHQSSKNYLLEAMNVTMKPLDEAIQILRQNPNEGRCCNLIHGSALFQSIASPVDCIDCQEIQIQPLLICIPKFNLQESRPLYLYDSSLHFQWQ